MFSGSISRRAFASLGTGHVRFQSGDVKLARRFIRSTSRSSVPIDVLAERIGVHTLHTDSIGHLLPIVARSCSYVELPGHQLYFHRFRSPRAFVSSFCLLTSELNVPRRVDGTAVNSSVNTGDRAYSFLVECAIRCEDWPFACRFPRNNRHGDRVSRDATVHAGANASRPDHEGG